MTEHADLGDDELKARLLNRGETWASADWLVRHRDEPAVAKRIAELLR